MMKDRPCSSQEMIFWFPVCSTSSSNLCSFIGKGSSCLWSMSFASDISSDMSLYSIVRLNLSFCEDDPDAGGCRCNCNYRSFASHSNLNRSSVGNDGDQ